jgi:hypothetical protein
MRNIRGGTARPYLRKSAPVKYDPADEAEAPKPAVKRPNRQTPIEDKLEPPRSISVRQNALLRSIVPGHVWKCGAFRWEPMAFGVESEKLNERVIDPRVQKQSLMAFRDDPSEPVIYGVAGNPDDTKAKLFAAYLVNTHVEALGSRANVVWHTLYGGFDNALMREYDPVDGKTDPTLLVLSNLTPNSTNVKLEKARDLLERFQNIPRIVICAGEDPMSFLTTRLYSEINALAYFSESLVKKKIEVI